MTALIMFADHHPYIALSIAAMIFLAILIVCDVAADYLDAKYGEYR
jgi:hypothetical protein